METVHEGRRKRLTREESRAQTRERLIEAAYQLFSTEGVEATSIDRIAEYAGYSRGAFYSNFDSRDALLAALTERKSERVEADFQRLEDAGLSPEGMVQALRDYALEMTADRKACLFYLELEMYGVRHPEVRELIGKFVRKDTRRAARFLDNLFASWGVHDHPPSELIISSYIALAQGLTMRQIVDPGGLSDQMLHDSLTLYFDSAVTANIPQLRTR
ncbi:MAG: TetR/AcrR family transcriptional regulator [Bryobacterales bacterium]|nr:TetR/AcrR family transcriptional regulator [Bryobacterales bacterium]MEB2363227.1 TetR/AcrR family transcriptional regulator [Bryobacterales bacterium]